MADLREMARGLRRWPWRAVAWSLAVSVTIDFAAVAVERGRPPESGPTLMNWSPPRLSPAQLLGLQAGAWLVINLALLATAVATQYVIRGLRNRTAGFGTGLLVLAMLPVALIGVGGTLLLFLSIFRG
jgi:hypothetical protein